MAKDDGLSRPRGNEIDAIEHFELAKAKKVVLASADGNGSGVDVIVNEDGVGQLAVLQPGHICTENSTTTILLADGIFTGEWQDMLNYGTVTVGINTDQDSATDGLVVQWSIDGTNVSDSDSFTIVANNCKVFTFGAARRYVRLMYTNGSTDQGSFNLETSLKSSYIKPSSHRIQDSIVSEDDAELVKSVLTGDYNGSFINIEASVGGALKAAIVDGQTTRRVEIEPLGSMKVVTPVRLVGTAFNNGTKDTNFWTETVSGTGSVTQAGQIVLSTGTTATSSARYDSVRKARKVTGTTNQFRMVGRLVTVPQADNVRRAGAYDADNGYFFQYNGTTFGVGSRKSTVDTIVNNGSFNGNYGATIDAPGTTLRRFVIDYTAVSAKFFIDGILLHTITSATDTATNTVDFKIRLENYNENANVTDNSFQVRFATILRLGELITNPVAKAIVTNTTVVLKYGAGILQRIVVTDNAGTIIVYDGTSVAGTILASIDSNKTSGTLEFNAPFSNGLTVVTATGAKATFIYE